MWDWMACHDLVNCEHHGLSNRMGARALAVATQRLAEDAATCTRMELAFAEWDKASHEVTASPAASRSGQRGNSEVPRLDLGGERSAAVHHRLPRDQVSGGN